MCLDHAGITSFAGCSPLSGLHSSKPWSKLINVFDRWSTGFGIFVVNCVLLHGLSCSVCYENFKKAIMFLKRFSSFQGFFESLLSVDQRQSLLLTGEFSIQCNTTILTKRSHYFHPLLNRLKLSWIKINKISAFKLNSFAFHFTFH